VVSLAPFVGELRGVLAAWLGPELRYVVTAALLLTAAAVLAVALHRLRRRVGSLSRERLSALALAAVLVALEVAFWTTGASSSDAVERVHLLEYAVVAILYLRAWPAAVCGAPRWALTLEAVAFVGLADETVQWLSPLRVGDGRDVLLNVYAGLIGLLVARGLGLRFSGFDARPGTAARAPRTVRRTAWKSAPRPGVRSALLAGALLVSAAGAFFDAVHLGHEIDDPDLGVFRSSFSPAGLGRAGVDRAARWARRSPLPLRPLAIEDAFLTEAGWHAQVRNAAVLRGDLAQAWRENRILERWYAPFLRLPRRSWPPAQRAWIESRLEAEHPWALRRSPGYRSPALIGRLVVAPPAPLLCLGIAAVAGALFALGVKCSAQREGEEPARIEASGKDDRCTTCRQAP
jgi:hypothetical protein